MTILTNFKIYTPEDKDRLELQESLNVLFLKSQEGVDWYECQELFKNDKLKIVFDKQSGRISSVAKDVSGLWPINACVADIEDDSISTLEGFKGKIFDIRTGKIKDRVVTRAELISDATSKISSLQNEVSQLMAPLQAAKELDMMTDEEAAYLKELQRYLVYLSRVTSQEGYPTNIEWPVLPTK